MCPGANPRLNGGGLRSGRLRPQKLQKGSGGAGRTPWGRLLPPAAMDYDCQCAGQLAARGYRSALLNWLGQDSCLAVRLPANGGGRAYLQCMPVDDADRRQCRPDRRGVHFPPILGLPAITACACGTCSSEMSQPQGPSLQHQDACWRRCRAGPARLPAGAASTHPPPTPTYKWIVAAGLTANRSQGVAVSPPPVQCRGWAGGGVWWRVRKQGKRERGESVC